MVTLDGSVTLNFGITYVMYFAVSAVNQFLLHFMGRMPVIALAAARKRELLSMRIETIRRAVCDVCGCTGPEALNGESPIELALEDGWIYRDEADETQCPNCAEEASVSTT